MDNDWSSTGFIPFLIALNANMTVLGLTGNTADSWALQCTLHALATLEHGNLSCIPVALGQPYPFMMTEQRFDMWTTLWGTLDWDGVFTPENLTYEAEGNDPTGGNPYRISKGAFIEGYPNTTYISQSAPEFMIEQVFKYPGQVSIYAAGSLTNVAAAIRMNGTFASTAKELVIMGGYVDLNLMQVQSALGQDLGADINFIVDPEAAHIALTADWQSITIAGNIANTQYLTAENITQTTLQSPNLYSDLLEVYYTGYPLWDETAAMIMAYPDVVASSEEVYMDVSTAYDSPFYGGTYLWGSDFAPSHARKVNYVTGLNTTVFWDKLMGTLSNPKQCVAGVPQFV
ncbi:Inosine/uridine-preferring nucleoside hydrolase domain-containing protein [Rhodofomes roseus]|uniref:Inosine/uridine-preferring nucleoside hydrolase domain-containing protein n=1 Tax=Rhodofomes roseus TaxID=34475 RepID=A0ABQ8K6U9_9APHY|nr:Inosine/uridine-preferring nucleoside hydrolase domain-containing protein [Rhodofomes roseus]KAH9832322.1 Inosine/uridine-preferring nucleoside hydrolase domain-containing protein [Rhodofomes roseus]